MTDTALYYALSTLAQCAATLAALIGALSFWRLERLREEQRRSEEDERRLRDEVAAARKRADPKALAPSMADRLSPLLGVTHTRVIAVHDAQRRLMDMLVVALLGTLGILALAIVGLVFVDALRTWVWMMRGLIGRTELSRSSAPGLGRDNGVA